MHNQSQNKHLYHAQAKKQPFWVYTQGTAKLVSTEVTYCWEPKTKEVGGEQINLTIHYSNSLNATLSLPE